MTTHAQVDTQRQCQCLTTSVRILPLYFFSCRCWLTWCSLKGKRYPNSEPVATYMKVAVDFQETNAAKSRRPIYFRRRPVHLLVRSVVSRRFFQGETPGHWAVEVGGYIWELENRNGVIDFHIGVWTNPGERDGRRLLATEREEIGYTFLSDTEIREAGE